MATSALEKRIADILAAAGVTLNGKNPWDPQIHNPEVYRRILAGGTLAVGESYMDGWWDVDDLAEMIARLAQSEENIRTITGAGILWHVLKARLFNRQSKRRAFQVGKEHYDIGNDLYEKMLDKRMTYTCAYWNPSTSSGQVPRTLDEAQEAKLDLVCRKIGVKKGDRILDIGGGWGSFAGYAAEKYGASVVAITVSEEQAKLGREKMKGLPVEIRVQDYRDVNDGPYDHIVSIGMFEHVGPKNYRTYMKKARELLKPDGLFLLHTIGDNKTVTAADPWFDKYIFPNGTLPSPAGIGEAINDLFVLEDWHNFGPHYDLTLHAWYENFEKAWPQLKEKYGERFRRMWRYYLLSIAGGFRARKVSLWQIVLSPHGVPGGYTSVR